MMARLINPAQRSMIKAQRAERWATAGDRWGNGLRVSGVHGPAVSKPRPALNPISCWPVGLMDKASASGAGDSRLESWAGQVMNYFTHCKPSQNILGLVWKGGSRRLASHGMADSQSCAHPHPITTQVAWEEWHSESETRVPLENHMRP